MTLAPVEALRKIYSPASNQHGEGAFPVALLVMAFELQSGAAVLPEIGAMYGPNSDEKRQQPRRCRLAS